MHQQETAMAAMSGVGQSEPADPRCRAGALPVTMRGSRQRQDPGNSSREQS